MPMVKQKSNDPAVRWRTLMALLLVRGLLFCTNLQVQTPQRHMLYRTVVNSKNETLAGLRAASR